ncbi:MAG: DUF1361 domain-containing protein, partial [Bacteroidota bacterium]
MALLLMRIAISGSLIYVFLVWNLFLAVVPYGMSSWLQQTHWIRTQRFPLAIFLGIWLLFLPNAPYLITDIMHLYSSDAPILWLDPLLLFVFGLNGLLFGIFSMLHIFQILSEIWSETTAKRMLFCIVFLCGFGIYLGRFQRWNSWEIFSNPLLLLYDSVRSLLHPKYYIKTWGITLGFGGFLWVILLGLQPILS